MGAHIDFETGDFKTVVKASLCQISADLLGDQESNSKGLIKHVKDVEEEVFGGQNPKLHLSTRISDLEKKVKAKPAIAPQGNSTLQLSNQSALQNEITMLRKSNAVLTGVASWLQSQNRSLQNQVYSQQDKQNILNLLVGGVAELEELNKRF